MPLASAGADTVSMTTRRRHEMSDSRPILFATDGSPSSAEAQKEAFELAQRLDAPLLVVSVAHAALPAVGYASYGYSNVIAELTEAEHHRVRELLATISASACGVGLSCSTVLADGLVVEEICRTRDRARRTADRGGLPRLGRRAAVVLRKRLHRARPLGDLPVLVVRPHGQSVEHAAAA